MRLTPFSYVVLVLVGEGGAGAHDLVRMMRVGRVYWTAAESQWYAEPKKLAEHGYLDAATTPGRTNARTHYTLTDKGRKALADWVPTPSGPIRMQNEPVIRALSADITDPAAVAEGLEPLRAELEAYRDDTAGREEAAGDFPSRERVLLINHRLARKLVVAQLEWLDEIQEELRSRG
jgi:PadR family transcriptional regulator, regulatory protein AphA